jgi:hypothetical protein
MHMAGQQLRRFQFSLRALLVVVTIVAIGCVVVPPLWHKVFPPKKTELEELIDLITSTIQIENGGVSDTSLTLVLGGGQEVHEQPSASDSGRDLGGGAF